MRRSEWFHWLFLLCSSFKPDTITSHGNGDRLNRGENTATKGNGQREAALSSLPKKA